jgi:hypothetical protein
MTARRARQSAYSECPVCYARVIFALTAKGKKQVLNYAPDPAGNTAAQQNAAGGWRARYSPPGEALTFPEKRYMPHAATSPQCAPPKDAGGQRAAAQDVVTELDQWRKANAANARAKRNRRGRRQPPPITGIRIYPGRQP